MRRSALFAAALFVLGSAILGTETTPAQENGVFAPFPSRFRVAVRDPQVRLTWRDSNVDVSSYRVYRHTEEITAGTFSAATLAGTVAPGVETFLDSPEPGSYHYAVLAENDEGNVYRVFIPYRNKTTEPVQITEQADEPEAETEVRGMAARREDERIIVTFEAGPEDRELVVYRSTRPLDSMDALARATRISEVTASDSPVRDYPVPGISYYYGVFSRPAMEEGVLSFEPGVTVTSEPVEIPLAATRVTLPPFDASPRSRNPLPFLRITRELEEGERQLPQNPASLSPRIPLESETEKAVNRLLATLPPDKGPQVSPHVLPADRSVAEKGPAYTLKSVVEGPFSAEQWEEAERLLANILSTSLPAEVEARAHFYLAQTYYFTDRPRLAFLEFLMAEEHYYLETRPWLDRILLDLQDS